MFMGAARIPRGIGIILACSVGDAASVARKDANKGTSTLVISSAKCQSDCRLSRTEKPPILSRNERRQSEVRQILRVPQTVTTTSVEDRVGGQTHPPLQGYGAPTLAASATKRRPRRPYCSENSGRRW